MRKAVLLILSLVSTILTALWVISVVNGTTTQDWQIFTQMMAVLVVILVMKSLPEGKIKTVFWAIVLPAGTAGASEAFSQLQYLIASEVVFSFAQVLVTTWLSYEVINLIVATILRVSGRYKPKLGLVEKMEELVDSIFHVKQGVKLLHGEEVEMVLTASPWVTTYPRVAQVTLIAGLSVSALVFFIWRVVVLFGLPLPNLAEYTIFVIPFLVFMILVITAFTEWNRKHDRLVVTTYRAWKSRVRIPWTRYMSFGPLTEFKEIQVVSPGEKVGLENATLSGRIIDGLLNKIWGIGDINLPSRYGPTARDRAFGLQNAHNIARSLIELARRAAQSPQQKTIAALEAQAAKAYAEIVASAGDARAGILMAENDHQVRQLLKIIQDLTETGEIIDLQSVEDPGKWPTALYEEAEPAPEFVEGELIDEFEEA